MLVSSRVAALLGVVGVLTVSGLVVNVSPASAVTGGLYDPAGYALSGDPLVASAAVSGAAVGTMSEGQIAGMFLNRIRYSPKWTAITSRLGFGASQIQADASAATQLSQLETAFAPIASKLAPVVDTVGGVATGVMVAQAGFTLGATVDKGVGVDVSGGLCASAPSTAFSVANTLLSFLTSTNCTEWNMSQQMKALENNDQVATYAPGGVGSVACASDGWCATFASVEGTGLQARYCITISGSPALSGNASPSADYAGAPGNFATGGAYYAYPDPGCATVLGVVWYSSFPVVVGQSASHYLLSWKARASDGPTAAVTLPLGTSSVPDPARTLRCDVTMTDNSVLSASTAVFYASSGKVPPYVCPAIPAAEVPKQSTVWQTVAGGADRKWLDLPTTPEYQADRTAHPDCTLGQCRLELVRVSDGLQCLDAAATCDGWFQDPAKTTDYKCVLGPYAMPLASCNAYEPTFNPQKVAAGTPYADPATGAEVGQTALPAGDPTTGVDPATGQCFPTGWGVFNPVEWVYKPVACALQSAFVPSPQTLTTAETTVTAAWTASTPGQLQEAVSASLPDFAAADSGCDGVLVNFPMWSSTGQYTTVTQHYMAACPGDFFASWAPLFSIFIGGSFTIVGILGAKRLVSALLGFHDPGIGA